MGVGIRYYYLFTDRLSADEFLMGMHIREPGAQANRALSLGRLDRARRS